MTTIDTYDTLNNVLIKHKTVVCVVVSDWCPDCHQTDRYLPVLKQFFPTIHFCYINREQFPDLANQYRIFGVPSFLVFKSGIHQLSWIDKNPKSFLEVKSFIDRYCVREGCA